MLLSSGCSVQFRANALAKRRTSGKLLFTVSFSFAPGRARLGFGQPGLFYWDGFLSHFVRSGPGGYHHWTMPIQSQMVRFARRPRAVMLEVTLAMVMLQLFIFTADTQSQTAPPAPAAAPEPTPATAPAAARNLRVDRVAGYVEVDATVVLRDAPWLELLACTPGSREHESILTVAAKPSEIHLALLILGLEPGSPMGRAVRPATATSPATETVVPPSGSLVRVSLVYESDGKSIEIPPSAWVRDRRKEAKPIDDLWVFAGSSIATLDDGTRIYRADANGNVISLVSFGDEVLARPGTVTNQDDQEALGCVEGAIPPVGSRVKIRLRPAKTLPLARPSPAATAPAAPSR
jgi:hypothetical protein